MTEDQTADQLDALADQADEEEEEIWDLAFGLGKDCE